MVQYCTLLVRQGGGFAQHAPLVDPGPITCNQARRANALLLYNRTLEGSRPPPNGTLLVYTPTYSHVVGHMDLEHFPAPPARGNHRSSSEGRTSRWKRRTREEDLEGQEDVKEAVRAHTQTTSIVRHLHLYRMKCPRFGPHNSPQAAFYPAGHVIGVLEECRREWW